MAEQPARSDPIGDRYFTPLVKADKVSDILFYVAGILSLLALVVEQDSRPQLNSLVQIGFAVVVVALFAVTLAVRLYFSPGRSSDAIRISCRTRSIAL